MRKKDKLFSDTWILIIGIPLVGISFPFIFGLRWGDARFFSWIFISALTTLVSWLATRFTISLIWRKFPWETDPFLHIVVGILLLGIFGTLTAGMVFLLNIIFFGAGHEYWHAMRPIRIGTFLAIGIITLIHETIHLFYKWKKELTHAADLEKENLRSKFDALKNHVNPHFLFNSLGTLTALIRTDPLKAERYVGEFSNIYRYFLEVNNNDLVTVEEELTFIDSYLFLQQIRFGDGFTCKNQVSENARKAFMLPLTLELLVENALKHNTTLPSSPLCIEIFDAPGNTLVVRNNYQPRPPADTLRSGLQNLEQRYVSFLGKSIRQAQDDGYFIVEIPMIPPES
jgi:sensor histidine kinase YesM